MMHISAEHYWVNRCAVAGFAAIALTSPALGEAPERIAKMLPGDPSYSKLFGHDVAMEGDFILIGAPHDSETDYRAGAAYLFDVASGTQLRKLVSGNGRREDFFGMSVAVNGSGLAVISAVAADRRGTDSGTAYVFNLHTGEQAFELLPDETEAHDRLGFAVAISDRWVIVTSIHGDGREEGSGAAYVFDLATGRQSHTLTADDGFASDWFGRDVAIQDDLAIVTAMTHAANGISSGAAYWFDLNTGEQIMKVTADDGGAGAHFGASVAIDGDLVVIGADGDSETAERSGAAYIFDLASGVQLHKLKAPDPRADDLFGFDVDISGSIVVVGAPWDDDRANNAGTAHLFRVRDGRFVRQVTDDDGADDDNYGWRVAVERSRAVVASLSDDEGSPSSGSAFLYDLQIETDPTLARLDKVKIEHGERRSGRARALRRIDDREMTVRAEFRDRERYPWIMEFQTKHTVSAPDPRFVILTVWNRTSEPGTRGEVEMRNQITGQWEWIVGYGVATFPQRFVLYRLDATKYVHPERGRIAVRIRHLAMATTDGRPFESFFDVVQVEVE